MRGLVFANRTTKEILRDPLSYVFCLGFPLVMLVVMTLVNNGLPAQAAMDLFTPAKLVPGIAYFGLSFVMIFMAIQIAGDRTTALIMRMHASPMKAGDYIVGYTLPGLVIALIQIVITFVAGFVISVISGEILPVAGMLLSMVKLIPSIFVFIAFGMIIGTVFNEKAAPGLCSVIVTVAGMLGGIWMPVDTLGGVLLKICKVMPFYHGVSAVRNSGFGTPLLITVGCAIVLYVLSVFIIGWKWKKDVA